MNGASGLLVCLAVFELAVAAWLVLVLAVRQVRRTDGPALRMWWLRLRVRHRAEQQQPDAGLDLLDARRTPSSRRKRRKQSWTEHVEQAMDVFNDEEQDAHDELLVAVQELQQTDPADLWSVYNREVSQ